MRKSLSKREINEAEKISKRGRGRGGMINKEKSKKKRRER